MTWKIGVLGMIHDHIWNHVPELVQREDVTLAVAEPNEAPRERARREYGVDRIYTDYVDLLESERPDAVLIFVDNAGTAPLVELAASYGKPILIEKPMADSLANAERMRVAVMSAGVPLMINWPTAWTPAIRHVLDLASGGDVGDIFRFTFRGGHRGPREYGCSDEFCGWLYDRERNGAGAYIDYCGYGVSMSRLLLGMPSRAQATIGRLRKPDINVDDNAALILRYHQAMATIEATWSVAGPVPEGGPVIWGSQGSLIVRRQASRAEGQVSPGGHILRLTEDEPEGQVIQPPELPEGERTATQYFLRRLANDQPIEGLVSLEVGRDTQEILEAGLQAARLGCDVSIPLTPQF